MGFGLTKRFEIGAAGLAILCAGVAYGCGAGSELDDYEDGIPDVVPVPESAIPGAAGGIGSACAEEDVCRGQTSCTTSVTVFSLLPISLAGGYCSQSCTSDADCPSGSGCLTQVGKCLLACENDDVCRVEEGYSCDSGSLLGGSGTFCMPAIDLGGGGNTGGLLGGLGGGSTGGFLGGLGGGSTGGLLGGTGGTDGGAGGLIGGLFGARTPSSADGTSQPR